MFRLLSCLVPVAAFLNNPLVEALAALLNNSLVQLDQSPDACIQTMTCAEEYNLTYVPRVGPNDPLPAGLSALVITSDSKERSFLVYVPTSYPGGSAALPVMFVFHGFSNSPECSYVNFGLQSLAEKEGIIAVMPQGVNNAWNAGDCCFGSFANDVLFFRDMVTDLTDTRSMRIDKKKIYSSGYSNGGYMSYRLACQASDLVAGIVPVAGALSKQSTFDCENQVKPVPVIHFHGTNDKTIKYENAVQAFERYPKLKVNSCVGPTTPTNHLNTASCYAYTNCQGDKAYMELCTLEGQDHAWPGANNYCPPRTTSCGCSKPDPNIDVLPYAWSVLKKMF